MTAQELAGLQQRLQQVDSALTLAQAQRGTLVAKAAQDFGVDPAYPVIPQLERAFADTEAQAQAVAAELDGATRDLASLVAQAEGRPC